MDNTEFVFPSEEIFSCDAPIPSSWSFEINKQFFLQTQTCSDDSTSEYSIAKKGQVNRPFGNREAVRKYREKKKAKIASLEDEVVGLRALNEQLMKKVERQALLEVEIARLKCLLVDIRGRIEGEIGSFPYHQNKMDNISNINIPWNDGLEIITTALNGDICGFDTGNAYSG
ncbi:hypothetical protein BUALT_Bualt19G0125900 [Buddleja alternifolia]|uniref:BZIP domain-containing protein n=1 Tax=Buddleja alternifolia TaxID=168488 RepID=A0AAV6WBS2_9LAMI|nr:hypothetical protein BUALT_Bualt19G0125900 [Buddleja alternifolia]